MLGADLALTRRELAMQVSLLGLVAASFQLAECGLQLRPARWNLAATCLALIWLELIPSKNLLITEIDSHDKTTKIMVATMLK